MIHIEICYICDMSKHQSYSFIYRVQRMILLVFFSTTAIALTVPLARLDSWLFPNQLFVLIASLVLYLVVVVVIGSMIHVVTYIPFNLARAFDPIKNEIVSGAIKDMGQLGERISKFTTEFFDFSFLDISAAFVETGDSGLISHADMEGVFPLLEQFEMLEKSKRLERIIRAGKLTFHGMEYHLYILPIWFGDRWLGYMGLLSEKRISRFFQEFLMEYEKNFLDDQVMLVLNRSIKG